jgi:hypothetical protein
MYLTTNAEKNLASGVICILIFSSFIALIQIPNTKAENPIVLIDESFENPSANYDPFNFNVPAWTNLTVGGPEGCIAEKSTTVYAPDGDSKGSLYLSCLLSDRLYLMVKDTGAYRTDVYAEGWAYITNYTLNIYQFAALHTSLLAITQNIYDPSGTLGSLGYINMSGTYKFALVGKGIPFSENNTLNLPTQENVWYHFALQVHIGNGDGYLKGWLSNSAELGDPRWEFSDLNNTGEAHNIAITAGRSGIDYPFWFIEDGAYYLDSIKAYDMTNAIETPTPIPTENPLESQPGIIDTSEFLVIAVVAFVVVGGAGVYLYLKPEKNKQQTGNS